MPKSTIAPMIRPRNAALVSAPKSCVVRVVVCGRVPWRGEERSAQATRTEFMTSFCCDLLHHVEPVVILPNTVWTPFRCRVLSSLSTMKNWLPPVSLPACAIDSAPTSCLCGLPAVSHLIF